MLLAEPGEALQVPSRRIDGLPVVLAWREPPEPDLQPRDPRLGAGGVQPFGARRGGIHEVRRRRRQRAREPLPAPQIHRPGKLGPRVAGVNRVPGADAESIPSYPSSSALPPSSATVTKNLELRSVSLLKAVAHRGNPLEWRRIHPGSGPVPGATRQSVGGSTLGRCRRRRPRLSGALRRAGVNNCPHPGGPETRAQRGARQPLGSTPAIAPHQARRKTHRVAPGSPPVPVPCPAPPAKQKVGVMGKVPPWAVSSAQAAPERRTTPGRGQQLSTSRRPRDPSAARGSPAPRTHPRR